MASDRRSLIMLPISSCDLRWEMHEMLVWQLTSTANPLELPAMLSFTDSPVKFADKRQNGQNGDFNCTSMGLQKMCGWTLEIVSQESSVPKSLPVDEMLVIQSQWGSRSDMTLSGEAALTPMPFKPGACKEVSLVVSALVVEVDTVWL